MKKFLFIIFILCFALCNNAHAALPSGYTLLQYIQNDSNTYINTGVTPNVDDIEMEILYDAVTGSNYIFQSQEVNGGPINGLSGSTNGNTINAPFNNGTAATSSIVRTAGKHIYSKATFNNGVSTLYVRDETNNTNDTTNGSYTFAVPGAPFGLFGNTAGKKINAGTKIYYAKMKVNGNYVIDYVPAKRNSDNTIGFYDMASNTFKVATTGSLIGGPETSEYTITYVLNGGTNYVNAPTSYTGGIGANVNGIPTRSGYIFAGWCTNNALTNCARTQTISTSATGNKTFYAKFEKPKFTITTTNLSNNTEFKFSLSAQGTFYVDCGENGTVSGTGVSGNTITRSSSDVTTPSTFSYLCTYTTGGVKTIKFSGIATGYRVIPDGQVAIAPAISFGGSYKTPTLIAGISGSLGAIFPTLGQNDGQKPVFFQTFYGCTNLTQIPATLFNGVTGHTYAMFDSTFRDCTGLTQIPENLFSGVSGNAYHLFSKTFSGCTGLTSIPGNLFGNASGGARGMFSETFSGCTGLISIPKNLFRNIDGALQAFSGTFNGCTGLTSIPKNLFSSVTSSGSMMFNSTFQGCTGITSIPDGLFSGITNGANGVFYRTFDGCTSLSGYIRPSTFSGLIANSSPTTENMWYNTFSDTSLDTSCPANTTPYTTGYETEWATNAGRAVVACKPPVLLATASYVLGMYNDVNGSKQNKLTSNGQNPNIILTGDSNGIVSSLTANNGVITVTRSNITLPVGSQTSTRRASIWTEQ